MTWDPRRSAFRKVEGMLKNHPEFEGAKLSGHEFYEAVCCVCSVCLFVCVCLLCVSVCVSVCVCVITKARIHTQSKHYSTYSPTN